jgi:hypothetical protein
VVIQELFTDASKRYMILRASMFLCNSLAKEKSCTGVQQVNEFMIFLDASKRYTVIIASYAFSKAAY